VDPPEFVEAGHTDGVRYLFEISGAVGTATQVDGQSRLHIIDEGDGTGVRLMIDWLREQGYRVEEI